MIFLKTLYPFEPADGGFGPADNQRFQQDGGADERRDADGALDDLRRHLERIVQLVVELVVRLVIRTENVLLFFFFFLFFFPVFNDPVVHFVLLFVARTDGGRVGARVGQGRGASRRLANYSMGERDV